METRSNNVLVGLITLALIAAAALFTIWLANLGSGKTKPYDIFFKQSVSGLQKGSNVTFSGVPVGQVEQIALWKPDPSFVRVRIGVDREVPVLQGTTASLNSVGFTGVAEIGLDGAAKGAPPISDKGPEGVPVIPTRPGGLGAILNNAPQLMERLTTLTERLTELMSDRNQNSIAAILEHLDSLSGDLAKQGPELQATMAQTRLAIRQAGDAAEQIGNLANSTTGMIDNDTKPLIADLRNAVMAANNSMQTLDKTITAAKPGIDTFSQKTMPEVGLLVRDLRRMSQSMSNVAERLDQGGATSILGEKKLPDYKGK